MYSDGARHWLQIQGAGLMFKQAISWKLFVKSLIIILVALIGFTIYFFYSLPDPYHLQRSETPESGEITQFVVYGLILAIVAATASLIIAFRLNHPFEKLRREFVENVSHELRTPITSIKGFLETLLDGAIDDPEDAQRFLQIASKQSDRLNAIVEDLLTLSRLEHDAENATIPFEKASVREALLNSIHVCENKAKMRNIKIELQCGDHLTAKIHPPLMEQAIVNLIDNAVKFSPENSTVSIEARREKKEVVIHVRDTGNGIEASHLPRLFERFYRVDKARSRSLGGTGLGLAITKHIVQLHRGRVYVASTPGQGSVFSIYIP